jgi:hypothetical protein
MSVKIETTCVTCEKPLVRYSKTPDRRFACSRACAFTPERRAQIGKVHKGKIESEETRRLKSESHKGKKPFEMTDEIRANIGRGSSAKFTSEYKKKDRKRREELGLVVPLEKKDDYLLFREFSNWTERMFDRVTDQAQLLLFEERGVFNNRTNSEGVVRDHMFSRWSGFQQGVFPELMRHPCNLQIITHSENVSKAQRKDKDDQTLVQLFSRIQAYVSEWPEQMLCLQLIKDYESGKRYDKDEYIKRFYGISSEG